MPSGLKVNKKGEKKRVLWKSTGYEMSRITVMLTDTADGQNLRPYVLLERKTMPKKAVYWSYISGTRESLDFKGIGIRLG
ncbi:hypothetical protein NPIL_223801 [Nephila pilipes]|uniref:Uncharacterized protein n=1 Tax=Nephila pilipes TaxID=299642 RepID=A0A8X6QPM7_NEPPI|nr:hypothetical protein NPIL_439741 [Nephila pilipes]GFU36052.1 hypothetical protein NPIL_223801 [Nephila pilipes]